VAIKERHLFPTGNTSSGFYSFYKYILDQEAARRIICLKGGPGTGKSTLMKTIGKLYSEKGFDIEYHHCSSSNDLLDAIVIKGLNVALLDGTSPHIMDPLTPGAVDEILNLGECWKEEGFEKYRRNIIEINRELSDIYKRSNKYLEAAKQLHEIWSFYNAEIMNISKLYKYIESLKISLFLRPISSMGKERHLFATAFTANGIITYTDNLITGYERVYVLNGEPGSGKTIVLKIISEEALKRGYSVEIMHHPLVPEKLEHIFIPQLKTAIITSNEINQQKFQGTQIYMDIFSKSMLQGKYISQIKEDKHHFYELLNKALEIISYTKVLHDELKKFYIENMDFDKVNEKQEFIEKKLDYYYHN
jgi:Cdc6-like AAA superfamily ATPase